MTKHDRREWGGYIYNPCAIADVAFKFICFCMVKTNKAIMFLNISAGLRQLWGSLISWDNYITYIFSA